MEPLSSAIFYGTQTPCGGGRAGHYILALHLSELTFETKAKNR
jgi:hypothetical protein